MVTVWLELCTSYSCSCHPPPPSSSCFNKIQSGDIPVPANLSPPGKWSFEHTERKRPKSKMWEWCDNPMLCWQKHAASNGDSWKLLLQHPVHRYWSSLVQYLYIIRSTSKIRPNNIRGKMSVRPSVRPQKVSSIWMKFGMYNGSWQVTTNS